MDTGKTCYDFVTHFELTRSTLRKKRKLDVVVCVIVFFQVYKEQVLEPMLNGTEKTPPLIADYREYHTDTTVKFIIKMSEQKLVEAEAAGLHKVFKLQTSLSCNNMVNKNPAPRV